MVQLLKDLEGIPMEIYSKNIKRQQYRSKRFDEYFSGLNVLIADIETSGLYPNNAKVILGGAAVPGISDLQIHQYFLGRSGNEKELLQEYCQMLSHADVIITYNGKAFDLPFLKQRLAYYNLDIDLDICQSFDLYRALHKYSRLREVLPNLKQKTIESFLGLSSERRDEISGFESVHLYNEYIRNGSQRIKELILLHNHDDLVLLSSILKILDKFDLHKILYYEGFTVARNEKRIYVKNINLSRNQLKVTGQTRNIDLDYYSFEAGLQAVHKASTGEFILELPVETDHGISYIDLESIAMDFTSLEPLSSLKHGYLITKDYNGLQYDGINKAIQIIFREILYHI